MAYEPKGFPLDIFKQRYAFTKDESFSEACERVARHVSSIEHNNKKLVWHERFFEELNENRFVPGGRIWYGCGRPKANLINCFVASVEDSREGWGELAKNTIIISGIGGGVGTNYSKIRPRGTKINGTGGKATGAVSLMRIINGIAHEIKAGGGRRSALMMALDVTHSDIIEFLDAKLNKNELNNANVSVVFNEMSPEEFFDKVQLGYSGMLKFSWRQEDLGEIPAFEIWQKIVKNSLESGEPGILNLNLANKMSNIYYYKPLECSNPCGETILHKGSLCCLGHLVLPRFVRDGEVDWDLLDDTIRISVRFLDNVLSVTNFPLSEFEEETQKTRRIGLGVTGLHDMLIRLGLDYTMKKSIKKVDEIFNFIKNRSYEASTYLSAEKGPFPVYDKEMIMKSGFIKKLKPSVKNRIRQYGLRNCALNTCAPTGTVSIMSGNCSSGIEPAFGPAWKRRYIIESEDGTENTATEIIFHPLFVEMMENDLKYKIENSYDLSIRDHLEMQSTCQKHIDQSISKTILIDKSNIDFKEYSETLMDYLPRIKGLTVYPLDSRENQPITPMTMDEAIEAWTAKNGENLNECGIVSVDACKDGACDL